jgi:hypothetical protein
MSVSERSSVGGLLQARAGGHAKISEPMDDVVEAQLEREQREQKMEQLRLLQEEVRVFVCVISSVA